MLFQKNYYRVLFVVSLMACSCYSRGQQDCFISINHLTTADGLSSSNVRKILKDSKGFIWIATQDGLNRYDGKAFTAYNVGLSNHHAIAGSDIRDMVADTTTRLLWVVSAYGGIDAIDYVTGNNVFSFQQSRDTSFKDVYLCSLVLQRELLYIGSSHGLYVLNTRTKRMVKHIVQQEINKLLSDRFDNLWLFHKGGDISILQKGELIYRIPKDKLEIQESDYSLVFYDVCQLQNGTVLATTSVGLKLFHPEHYRTVNHPFPAVPALNGITYACSEDQSGDIWISTVNSLIRINNNTHGYSVVSENNSYDELNWLNAVYSIHHDKDDIVWLGCQQGLAFGSRNPPAFYKVNTSSDRTTSIRHAYYIFPFNDSLIYCCAENGLYLVKGNRKIAVIDEHKAYYHVFRNVDGKIIVSNDEGLFVYSNHSIQPIGAHYKEFNEIDKIVINSHIVLGDSVIIMGTENELGLVMWDLKRQKVTFLNNLNGSEISEKVVNTIFLDQRNTLWILSDHSVSLLDLNSMRFNKLDVYSRKEKKFLSIFFDVCQAGAYYYIASYTAGVLVYDANYRLIKEISVGDGLTNHGLYKILPYRDSLLFVTSNNGLSLIDIKKNVIRRYYDKSGLQSSEFEEMSGNVLNNKIYAGGKNGFTIIDPSLLSDNKVPPKVFISGVRIETSDETIDTSNLDMHSIAIPANVVQTTIYFAGLAYSNPFGVSFAYNIVEEGNKWVDIGTQHFVNLIGLQPGTYRLMVKSANEHGVWSEPIELTLIFLPKWYQTWWFKTAVVLLLMGILYSLYRYRLAQIRKEQQIRQRIASDLHDDIGSTLNSVKVFTNLAMMKPENNITYLQQLKEGVQNAIVGVRDMVWVLDDKQDTLGHLLERIELFINPLASAQDIRFEKSLDAPLTYILLKKEEKRNLYLIIKEALNNSIKYASATTLQLIVEKVSHDKYTITIRDDGKGFDMDLIQKGNGLNNLQYRAQQIKYAIEIDSVPGKGTTITLTRP